MEYKKRTRIVIIGAGFAGLHALKILRKKGLHITIIDRFNFHSFTPLLYQVAAAEISPEQIAHPVRKITGRGEYIHYIKAVIREIDAVNRRVYCGDRVVSYDYLVVANGSRSSFLGIPGAEKHAFPLKTMNDAISIRNHILTSFEEASRCTDTVKRQRLLSFVIVGCGPTGVEFASSFLELVKGPLRRDFPSITMDEISIIMVEALDRVLQSMPEKLSEYARSNLEKKRISVILGRPVKKISPTRVVLDNGTTIATETVIWTAGVTGNAPDIQGAGDVLQKGFIPVDETLRPPRFETVYAVGDVARHIDNPRAVPMDAASAIQQGKHGAKNILRQIRGKEPVPFRYNDRSAMVSLGRNNAVVRIGGLKMKGFVSWLLWIFVHIVYLIGFRNKLVVLINWAWNYIFYDKVIRLIIPDHESDYSSNG